LLVDLAIAFVLISAVTWLIYILGRHAAPKPAQSENERAKYACGEKAWYHNLRVRLYLHKYLICFMVLDSSALLLAYGSITAHGASGALIVLYTLIMFAASLLLFGGGKD